MVKNYTNLYWYGYKPAALFACLSIGYAISMLTPRRQHGLEGLTMFDIEQVSEKPRGPIAIDTVPWTEWSEGVRFASRFRVLSDTRGPDQRKIGVSYEELGIAVTHAWNLPDGMVQSLRHVKEDRPRKPATDADRLRLVCALSREAACAPAAAQPQEREHLLKDLATRYGGAVAVTDRQLGTVVQDSVGELAKDSLVLDAAFRASPVYRRLVDIAHPYAILLSGRPCVPALAQSDLACPHGRGVGPGRLGHPVASPAPLCR